MKAHELSQDDRDFRTAFEACTFAPSQFTHEAHVRLAYVYLAEHDDESAVQRMREGLLNFIDHNGIPRSKFHETITRAWVLAVRHFMTRSTSTSSADFIAKNRELLDSKIMLTHYSASVLFSADARASFVEPDLDPIPEHGKKPVPQDAISERCVPRSEGVTMVNMDTVEIKAFVPAKDFERSKSFYMDLGFTLAWSSEDLAYVHAGSSSFLLQKFYVKEHAECFMMHLLVKDVEAWWQHVEIQQLANKYGVRVNPPEDRPWGIRDFTIDDPTGVLWRIGQNIELAERGAAGDARNARA